MVVKRETIRVATIQNDVQISDSSHFTRQFGFRNSSFHPFPFRGNILSSSLVLSIHSQLFRDFFLPCMIRVSIGWLRFLSIIVAS